MQKVGTLGKYKHEGKSKLKVVPFRIEIKINVNYKCNRNSAH